MFWRRKTLKTPKLVQRRRRIFLVKMFAVVLFIGVLTYGVVYLLNREEILIDSISISGTKVLAPVEVETFVFSYIEGNYLFVIPRSNIFLYPKSRLQAGILENFKRVKEVDIHRNGWRGMRIEIEERNPHTQWCGENRLDGVIPECYFLDEDGFIYAKAPLFTGDVYFHFYGPLSNGEPVGQYFFERDAYRSLTLFLTSLRTEDILAVDFAIRDEDDYEMYLGSGTRVIFGRDQDLGNVIENLKSVLSAEEFQKNTLGSVEYIDLRFGNKVYYRIQNSSGEL